MTKEQAEKEIRDNFMKVWADGIIKALEQEPTLDKIREEIEQEYKVECEHPYGQGLRRSIDIIDKYRTESEA